MGHTEEKLIKDDDGVFHRVSGVSYGQDTTTVNTFCSTSVLMDDDSTEPFSVPLHLLDKTAVCRNCERTHRYIQSNRFPSRQNWSGEYSYVVRLVVRHSDDRGTSHVEVVEADSVSEAKQRVKSLYNQGGLRFERISRHDGTLGWTVVEERGRTPDSN